MSRSSLLDSELDTELRSTVETLMQRVCDCRRLVAMSDGDRSVATELWDKIRFELGLSSILIPEENGGVGLSLREAAVIMEVLGQYVASTPFLTSSIVATTLLLSAKSEMIGELASGRVTAALAVPLSTAPMAEIPCFSIDADGRVIGSASSVAGAIEADVLIAPVKIDNRIALYSVSTSSVSVVPRVSLDMTRQVADVICRDAEGVLVLADAESALRRSLIAGAVVLSSEQVGIARWCLESTVSYLKERRQFGQALGNFQALKHRLADLYVGVENASAAARFAAVSLADDNPESEIAAGVAQAFCSDLAVLAGEEAVQLHAGMGMTWEHPAHLYLKRAKADQIAFGTAGDYRTWLSDLINLPRSLSL